MAQNINYSHPIKRSHKDITEQIITDNSKRNVNFSETSFIFEKYFADDA